MTSLSLRAPAARGCSPAPGQHGVHGGDTVCRGLDLHEVVRLHQAGGGLQHSGESVPQRGRLWTQRPEAAQSQRPEAAQPRSRTMRKAE